MKKATYSLLIILILPCIFAFHVNAQEVQNSSDYSIVMIDDGEEVPLAAEMSNQPVLFSAIMSFALLLVGIVLVILIYMLQCYKYRERIRLLYTKDNRTKKIKTAMNWNLFQLKDMENELENYLASSIRID